ncbi:hypothetical protein GCM10025858_12530 [Alicyclobacillus sacchari]|nr:hypothetical protein GCM10025858_12530 [Alicyclobacillus sacchari]
MQRQSLYTEADARVGRPKAIAAADALRAANSDITVERLWMTSMRETQNRYWPMST